MRTIHNLARPLTLCGAVVALLCLPSAHSELLRAPTLEWSYALPGSGTLSGRGLAKGNGVVAHPHGNFVYITADDGSLHILDSRFFAEPQLADALDPIVFEPNTITGTHTECSSSVAVVNDALGRPSYLLYAVVDVPIATNLQIQDGVVVGNVGEVKSRLIAVNFDGSSRWSLGLDGRVAGTPVVAENGRYIYASHNVENDRGRLSVISTTNGLNPIIAATKSLSDRTAPFGPPALRTLLHGTFGLVEVVAVAEGLVDDSLLDQGGVHVLVPSADFQALGGQGNNAFDLRVLSNWPYASIARPALGPDATSVFAVGAQSTISGWTNGNALQQVLDGTSENIGASWSDALQPSERDPLLPLSSSPVLSPEGDFIFIAGNSFDLFCLRSDNGQEVWAESTGQSVHVSEPRTWITETDNVVYAIESMNGNVKQIAANNGRINWQFSCADLTGTIGCQDAVEADFDVSPSGNLLFYGDKFGKIAAIRVGDFETSSPTPFPSDKPSLLPSSSPSQSFVPTPYPSVSASPSLPPASPVVAVVPTNAPSTFTAVDSPTNSGSSPTGTNDAPSTDTGGDQNSLAKNAGDGDGSSGDNLVIILAAAAGGALAAILIVLFFVVRRRRRLKEEERSVVIIEDLDFDEVDKSQPPPPPPPMKAQPAKTPQKSKESAKTAAGVETPDTLNVTADTTPDNDNISETGDDGTVTIIDDDTVVVVQDDGSLKKGSSGEQQANATNLAERFDYVVEVQTEESMIQDASNAEPTKTKPPIVVPSLLSTSSFESTASQRSDLSDVALVAETKERKNSQDDLGIIRAPSSPSRAPIVSTPISSPQAKTTQAPLSPLLASPGSTIFIEDSNSYVGPQEETPAVEATLSPLSPHIISKALEEDAPDDEVTVGPSRRGPALNKVALSPESVPDDEITVMKPTTLEHSRSPRSSGIYSKPLDEDDDEDGFIPKVKRSAFAADLEQPTLDEDRMAITRSFSSANKFGKSVRPRAKANFVRETDANSRFNDSGSRLSGHGFSSSQSKPAFKRASRSKPDTSSLSEASAPKKEQAPLDPWSTFLKDLEAAETQFFNPIETRTRSSNSRR